MPHMRWVWIVLFFVTVGAFLMRFWWLNRAPSGLLIDEAHYGYIANSIAQTGKDEHGVSYPIVFRGFGDQKMPVYGYVLVPFVKMFGMNAIAVRLPSVIAGTLVVLFMFVWLRELEVGSKLALFGAIITAISPWTFLLSRFAFESNVALLFFMVGLIFLTKALKNKPMPWLPLTAVAWALTWYTYVAYRPVTIALAVLCIGFAVLKSQLTLKMASVFFVVLGILIAPLFHPNLSGSSLARFQQVGIISDKGIALEVDQQRTFCSSTLPSLACYALWNKGTVVGRELIFRFINVFSPHYLVTDGDDLRYLSVAKTGQFFFILYPLLLLGLVAIIFDVEGMHLAGVSRWLILSGLLVSPIPAILSGEPQKVRLSALAPFLIVAIVLGAKMLLVLVPRRWWRSLAIAAFTGVLLINTISYLINFYIIHSVKNDLVYQSYLPEVFSQLRSLKKPAEAGKPNTRVYIKKFFSDPIMAYAYYDQVDPAHYQSEVVLGEREQSGFQHAVELDDYYVTDDPVTSVGCRAQAEGYMAYFVTNEEFYGKSHAAKIKSTNGAVSYAFIYDAVQFVQETPGVCQ